MIICASSIAAKFAFCPNRTFSMFISCKRVEFFFSTINSALHMSIQGIMGDTTFFEHQRIKTGINTLQVMGI